MRVSRKLLAAPIFSLAISTVYAQTISSCTKQDDAATCYLNLAHIETKKITDHNDQAEAIAGLLNVHAQLGKTNLALVEQAGAILRAKKNLKVENRLELTLQLHEYSKAFKLSVADNYYRALIETIKIYANDRDEKSLLYLASWACDIFEKNQQIWDDYSNIYLNYCRLNKFEDNGDTNLEVKLIKSLGRMSIAIAYERPDILAAEIEFMERFIGALRALASSDKKLAAESAKASRRMHATINLVKAGYALRERNYQIASAEIDSARKIYQSLDFAKVEDLNEIVEFRISLADLYGQWGNFAKATESLSDFRGSVEGNLASKKTINRLFLVQYLTSFAINSTYRSELADGYGEQVWGEQDMRRAEVAYLEGRRLLRNSRGSEDTDFGLKLLLKSANRGHAIALHDMGVIFRDAEFGVRQDFQRAFKMFSHSAELGFAGAQNNLGDLYENGFGTDKSYGDAMYWYLQAAQQGEPTAYLGLGTLFAKGYGVTKDPVKATYWLSLASLYIDGENNKTESFALLKDQLSLLSAVDKNKVKIQVKKFRPYRQERNLLTDSASKE
jgi:TPR repeat protein